jgi:flagellar protein FliS
MPNLYENYIESEILTADPIKLIQLLYRGALQAVSAARNSMRSGDIPGRSKQISKAAAIVNELAQSLDHSKGPEISRPLTEIYDYIQRRLIDANVQQMEAPLIEVESLLGTLAEAWQNIAPPEPQPATTGAYRMTSSEPDYEPISYSY